MMHIAAGWGEAREAQKQVGFEVTDEHKNIEWNKIVKQVQMYIKKLNWGHKSELGEKKVTYFNKLGRLVSAHEIEVIGRKEKNEGGKYPY